MKRKLSTLIHGLLENPMGEEMKIVEFPINCGLAGMMHHAIALSLHSVELKKPRDYI